MKLNLKKVKGLGKGAWKQEKQKAAVFLKIFGENPIGRQAIHQAMKMDWYRHIDKALEGKTIPNDSKQWKKMAKRFKKQIVGVPTQETEELLAWMQKFAERVKKQTILEEDVKKWLPQFRSYMQDCESNATDNYIIKNKLMGV